MQPTISHHIQKHITSVLTRQKYARFRDLRPQGVDTNLYSYHLKCLQRDGWVEKTADGYTLSRNGLIYADRLSTEKQDLRLQPKIVTILVVRNTEGRVLLRRRDKQPYIDAWELPNGKLHVEDASIHEGAKREWREKIGGEPPAMRHAGDCYIRVLRDGEVVSATLAHVFYAVEDDIAPSDALQWARPHRLAEYPLAPATEPIIARTFFNDPYFFEEFDEQLQQVSLASAR